MRQQNPIIVALDFGSAKEARSLIAKLGDVVDFYKAGMEIYAAEGMPFVRELIAEGKQVFLDLKIYDIPETVKRAVAQIAPVGVRFLSIHARNSVMRAAVAGRAGSPLGLLGVTVLTSFEQQDLIDDGHTLGISELVALRARNAVAGGMSGIVCSPLDAAAVRRITGPKITLVTPGVRSRTSDAADQKRIATPAEAVEAGADYLVMGRQITRAQDPRAELERVLEEIEEVKYQRVGN